MRARLAKLFDPTFFRFILVGLVNTAVGYGVMFGLYNLTPMARLLAGMALSEKLKGNLTLLAGSGLFVVLNYGGQRWFAFKSK